MRACRKCDALMEDGMIFCPQCGGKYVVRDTNTYAAQGCPVVIVEQNIIVVNDDVSIVLVFGSIIAKEITACAIKLKCADSFGDAVSDTLVKYSDLNTDNGEIFGTGKIIIPVDSSSRKIKIIVEKVLFGDGTLWENEAADNPDAFVLTNGGGMFSESLNQINTEPYQEIWARAAAIDKDLKEFTDDIIEKMGLELIDLDDFVTFRLAKMEERKKQLSDVLSDSKTFMIPDGVEVISSAMFSDMKVLESVIFPSSLKKIEFMAFSDCSNLSSVVFSNGLREIEFQAFKDTAIKSITLPESIEYLSVDALDWNKLNELRIAESSAGAYVSKKISVFAGQAREDGDIIVDIEDLVMDNKKIQELNAQSAKKYLEAIIKGKRQNATARIEQYWAANPEERGKLESELSELSEKRKELFERSTVLKKKVSEIDGEQKIPLSIEDEKNKLQRKIDDIKTEISSLGIFKGKEKKALKEEQDRLNTELEGIGKTAETQRIAANREFYARKSVFEDELRPINAEIEQIRYRVEAINKKLINPVG